MKNKNITKRNISNFAEFSCWHQLGKSLLFAIVFILAIACQEPLNVDYTGIAESFLLVEGKITTDTTKHFVVLSRTTPLNANKQIWETEAIVTIKNNEQIINLSEETPGHYYTNPDIYGEIGEDYNLNIELSNGEIYTASTHINNVPEIDSVKFIYEEYMDYNMFFHNLYFHGWELEEEGNAYLWSFYLNDTLYNDTLWKTNFVDDEFVNGKYIGINSHTGESNFAIYTLQPHEITSDTNYVTVEMESIPLDYYNFWQTFMSQTVWIGSPFDANKADPTNNISNDGIGFFYGASVRYYSFIYIRPKESINVDQPHF